MPKPPILLALVLACDPQPAAQAPQEPAPSAHPSVLLVVLDTVRADRLSTYGAPRLTDPGLAQLAAEGVVFADTTSPASWTWPAHASLFTGEPPWVHGAHTRSDPGPEAGLTRDITALRGDLPTLAERLSAAGYRTRAISQNVWLHPALGLTRGFGQVDIVQSCPDLLEATRRASLPQDRGPEFLFVNIMLAHAPWHVAPAPWLAGVPERLAAADRPAWIAPFHIADPPALDLYRPITPGGKSGFAAYMSGEMELGPADLALVADLYDGGVAAADYCMRRALGPWRAAHPDGIVMVVSDHGEFLGENRLLEHGQTLGQAVLGVPFVLSAPGRIPAGLRIDRPVQLQDAPGTLLDLLGLPPLGRSLMPLVRAEPWEDRPIQAAAWHSPEPARSIGGPFLYDWKGWREGQDVLLLRSDGAVQLYDLKADPRMEVDLAASRPERVAELQAHAAGQFPEATPAPAVAIPPDVAEALRSIGYIGEAPPAP